MSENSHRQLTYAEERGHEVLRAAGAKDTFSQHLIEQAAGT